MLRAKVAELRVQLLAASEPRVGEIENFFDAQIRLRFGELISEADRN
jgi:hypothetical protein